MLKRHHPQKSLFLDLEELVPKDHLLRRIDAAVDLSFIHQRVAHLYSPSTGRPSVDPEVALRMMLLGYLFNLSDLKLSEEVSMHAGYRWFCRLEFHDPVPDRTTLVKLRRERWGRDGVFDDLMREVVRQCIQAGLVRGEAVVVDGTQVQANAGIQSLAELQPAVPLETYLDRFAPSGRASENQPNDPPPPSDGASASSQRRQGGKPDFRGERLSNETHRSTTDPDARLYRKAKGQEAKLRYLVHDAADLDSGVILATQATVATGTAEREAALLLLEQAIEVLPDGPPRYLVADKGYDAGSFLAAVEAQGVEPVVILRNPEAVEVPSYRRKTFDIARYRKRRQRVREAQAHNQVVARASQRRRLRRRRVRIERCFAEAKQWHGLDRARSRGLEAMQIQALLTATVQNLKRLARFMGRKRGAQVQSLPKQRKELRYRPSPKRLQAVFS